MEWINVDKELPEFQEQVLCIVGGVETICFGFLMSVVKTKDGARHLFDTVDARGNHKSHCSEVLFWCPIPKKEIDLSDLNKEDFKN